LASQRHAFSWRNTNFAPDEHTAVEVSFSPTAHGTLVCVTHRGWSALRADHPARHGRQGALFNRMIGLWWGERMSSLREHCATSRGAPWLLAPIGFFATAMSRLIPRPLYQSLADRYASPPMTS